MERIPETIEDWFILGNDFKILEEILITTCKNSKGISKKYQNNLIKVRNKISKLKSDTEDKMLSLGFFPDEHDMTFSNVFYGKPKDAKEIEAFIAEYKRKYETGKQNEKSAS